VVGALQSAEGLLSEGSAARYNLELLLEEGAGAARSLRLLADYREQNPDALIKGKYGRWCWVPGGRCLAAMTSR
jgi:hypothetical protein